MAGELNRCELKRANHREQSGSATVRLGFRDDEAGFGNGEECEGSPVQFGVGIGVG